MKDRKESKAAVRGGFTLVELVVVIVILGILAGVAYPAYTGYIKKANDAKVLSILSSVLTAAESATAECPDILGPDKVPELYQINIDVSKKGVQLVDPKFTDGTGASPVSIHGEEIHRIWHRSLADFSGGLIIYRSAPGGDWPRGYLEGEEAADFYADGWLKKTSYENAKAIRWNADKGWQIVTN